MECKKDDELLTLYEDHLLLSIHEEKGIFIRSSTEQIKPGLTGVVLAELALSNKIRITNNRWLQICGDEQINDAILGDAFAVIAEADEEHKLS